MALDHGAYAGRCPSSTTWSRSASTATTSPTSRRWPAAAPPTTRSTPPTAASARPQIYTCHRSAHRHGRREGRHRPVGVPLQERGPAGRPHHQQPSLSRLRLSRRCSRRPSPSTTSTRPRPKRPRREGRHVGVGISMGGFIITIGMFDSRRGGAGAQPRRHHHPLQHLGGHGPGRRHRHAHPHREGAGAAGHQARAGASWS